MKYWKRTLSILIVFALSFGIFVGCTPESGIDVSGTHSDSHSQSSRPTDSAVPSDPSSHTPTDSAVPSDPSSNTPTDSAVPSDPSSHTPTDSTPPTDEVEVTKEYTTLTLEDDFPVGQLKLNINPNKALRSYRVKDFPEVDCIGIMDSVRHDEDADRYVVIALTELTKEGTLSAIKTLEQREDVLSVNPVTEEYMDALLVGAYDFRSDVEDNKEFIFGEILITLYPSASRKTYTKEDFSDVNCIELKQDYWSHINTYDMTVILEDKTREGTIAAAEKLTEREDIRIISFNHEGDLDNATTD